MEIHTKLRFYRRTLPNPRDKVVFEYMKLEETLVRIKLLEYDDFPALILLNELTRMKKVNSLQKLCPIGQIGVGEVLSTEKKGDEIYVLVSIKNLPKTDQTKYLDYYHKSKKLFTFMKRISVNTKRPLLEISELLSWPIYDIVHELGEDAHPLDYIDHPDKIKAATSTTSETSTASTASTASKTSASVLKNEDEGKEEKDEGEKGQDVFGDVEGSESVEDTTFTLTNEMAELLLASHEQFFGKLIMQKTIRVGLISYAIDGAEMIKKTLITLLTAFEKKFPNVTMTVNLRDVPVYEIRIKSMETDQLGLAHDFILEQLGDRSNGLLFRHISTK